MEDQSQSQAYERYYDALASMEAQLISLYEEKMSDSSALTDQLVELEELRDTVRTLEAQVADGQIQFQDARAALIEQAGFEIARSEPAAIPAEVLEELNDLRAKVADFESRPVVVASAGPESTSDGFGMNTVKLIKQNLELSNRNETLQSQIDDLKIAVQRAQGEAQRLSLNGDQQVLQVRQELQEEITRARSELTQVKKRFKEVGAYLLENFLVEG